MPMNAKTHEENRQCVYFFALANQKSCETEITERSKSLIQEFFLEGFNLENYDRLPTVLCGNYHVIVNEHERGDFRHAMELYVFSKLRSMKPSTRASCLSDYYTCLVA